jgi:hypothetical protein
MCAHPRATIGFVIPGRRIKNGEERLVVLNRVAKSIVESVRGIPPTHVSVRETEGASWPLAEIYNTAWKSARESGADARAEQHGEQVPLIDPC